VRRAPIFAAVLGVMLAAAAPAQAESIFVSMNSTNFSPSRLDVLAGDNVVWRNNSQKTHNVKFETEGFNSGRVAPRGGANHAFTAVGSYPYVCTIHDGMTGEVGVHSLLLSGPTRRVRRGTSIALHVRVPDGSGEVTIEADSGGGFQPVAVAGAPDGGGHEGHVEPGTRHASIAASETATYRAVSSAGTSQELRVEVTDAPDLAARARRRRGGVALVSVAANPATPGARVVLQLKLRERFGWWPVARARLNRRSRAEFRVRGHGGAPARVALVGADWSTSLSQSRVLKLPGRR
jgi:plastocyanin